jgi:hypothetical protein
MDIRRIHEVNRFPAFRLIGTDPEPLIPNLQTGTLFFFKIKKIGTLNGTHEVPHLETGETDRMISYPVKRSE